MMGLISQRGYSIWQTPTTLFVTKNTDILWPFRSKQTGNWIEANSWESSVDGMNWSNAIQKPTEFNAGELTIRNTYTVTVSANTTTNNSLPKAAH